MSKKIEYPRPFPSGKCRTCHSEEQQKTGLLCDACERYVSQDYLSRKEVLLSDDYLEQMEPIEAIGERKEFLRLVSQLDLAALFREANLSLQQKRIFRQRILKEVSFGDIAKNIGVSKGSVMKQYERALKKLQFCLPISLLVRGESRPLPKIQRSEQKKSVALKASKEHQATFSVSRTFCPRCRTLLSSVDQDFHYCMNCGWHTDHELF